LHGLNGTLSIKQQATKNQFIKKARQQWLQTQSKTSFIQQNITRKDSNDISALLHSKSAFAEIALPTSPNQDKRERVPLQAD